MVVPSFGVYPESKGVYYDAGKSTYLRGSPWVKRGGLALRVNGGWGVFLPINSSHHGCAVLVVLSLQWFCGQRWSGQRLLEGGIC